MNLPKSRKKYHQVCKSWMTQLAHLPNHELCGIASQWKVIKQQKRKDTKQSKGGNLEIISLSL